MCQLHSNSAVQQILVSSWILTLYSSLNVRWSFMETCCLHIQNKRRPYSGVTITLTLSALRTSNISTWKLTILICVKRTLSLHPQPPDETAPNGPGPPYCRYFTTTLRHNTLGWTTLDGLRACRRDVYLHNHNIHKRQKSTCTNTTFTRDRQQWLWRDSNSRGSRLSPQTVHPLGSAFTDIVTG